ncbi:MAG: hypothetical protein KTR24_03965, partial [Saprospiraceae bacterium]|nr:hypothetical protein [Saprospiraceae bacterium]
LSRNDRRHQLKFGQHATWGKLRAELSYTFTSGRRYLDLAQLASGSDRRILTPNSVLPDYHRIDIGLGYEAKIGRTAVLLYTSIVNALDRSNVKYLQYVFSVPNENGSNLRTVVGSETNLLPRTLDVGVQLKW